MKQFRRLRSFHQGIATARTVDRIATPFIVVMSASALMLTLQTWQHRRTEVVVGAELVERPLPAPQSLQGAAIIGSAAAGVAIIQYSDFQCQFCGVFARDTWPRIKREYVDQGTVIAAFRHLPLSIHRYARRAAVGADCARFQGRFWQMHDLFFNNQSRLGEFTAAAPVSLGLDQVTFQDCMRHDRGQTIDSDLALAAQLGINSTPTFLIGKRRSTGEVEVVRVVRGAQSFDRFRVILDSLLTDRSGGSS